MAYLRDRRAFGNIGTRKFRGARFGDALSPRFSGLLDQYGGAAAAYSLRALSSGWVAGDVVRARRVNTPGEANFTAGQVANGELATWALSGDAFVTTWYDQSGNANNATQATTTAQPKIVSAGALVAGGLGFDGVDDFMDATGASSVDGSADTSIVVGQVDDITTSYVLLDSITISSAHAIFGSSAGVFDAFFGSATDNTYYTPSNTSQNLHFVQKSSVSASSIGYLNGVGGALDAGTTGFSGGLRIGKARAAVGLPLSGIITEVIIYHSDQSANRVGIESNINAAYTIY